MRRIASGATLLACLAIFVTGCAASGAPVPEVNSTTGPAVTARLDRCYVDPSEDNQVVAEVTVVNHSQVVHDVVVTILMGSDIGTHDDLAIVHGVLPGQSGTGAMSNHLHNSHRPTCVIADVQAL